MTLRLLRRSPASAALAASISVLVALCLFTQASETMAGYTARVTNSANNTATAQYFTCDASYSANYANALFAYPLNDSGTSVVSPGSTTYEAETAALSGGTGVATDRAGYSGGGYVAGYTDAHTGASTVFTVSAPAADTYTIAIRYASGSAGVAGTLSLQVGGDPVQQVTFPALASRDDWSTVYLSSALPAGSHSVALVDGPDDTADVALDYLQVSPRSAAAVRDTFSGTTGATLQSRDADVGGAWSKLTVPGSDDDAVLTGTGRIRKSKASSYAALYTSSTAPTSADYTVSADIEVLTSVPEDRLGVIGRVDPARANGTFYLARYEQAAGAYVLHRVIDNRWTELGRWNATATADSTHRLALEMIGPRLRMLVDGTQRVSAFDSGITRAGRAGVALGYAYNSSPLLTAVTETEGMHLDNFEVTYQSVIAEAPAADSSPLLAHGAYHGSRATDTTALACPRDAGPAYVLDGRSSYVSNPIAWTGTDVFTAELWFKTTIGGGRLIGFGNAATGASSVSDRMIYLTDDGQVVFGVYSDGARTVRSMGARNFADGKWHHVAATLSPGGMLLYLDGTSANSTRDPSTTTARSGTGYWRIGYDAMPGGWPDLPSNPYFAGSIRFAAVFTAALSADEITRHRIAGL